MATVRDEQKRDKGLLFCKTYCFFALRVAVDVDVVFAYKHYVDVLPSSLGLQKHRKQPEKFYFLTNYFVIVHLSRLYIMSDNTRSFWPGVKYNFTCEIIKLPCQRSVRLSVKMALKF